MVKIRLAAVRVNAGMTQEEWSEKLGVTKQTVCNWESGKTCPNLTQVKTMSNLSGVPIDFIFVEKESI